MCGTCNSITPLPLWGCEVTHHWWERLVATEPLCFICEGVVNRRLNRFFIFSLFLHKCIRQKPQLSLLGGYFSAFNQTTAKTVKWNLWDSDKGKPNRWWPHLATPYWDLQWARHTCYVLWFNLILLWNVSKPWKNWKKRISKICKPFTRLNTSEHLDICFFICIYDTCVWLPWQLNW